MKKKTIILIFGLLFLLFFYPSANASFIETTVGGLNASLDQENNLIWLNWNETKGMSRPEVEALMNPGEIFYGWRYASFNEINEMLRFFFPFFNDSSPNYYSGMDDGLETASYADFVLFENLITSEMAIFDQYIGVTIYSVNYATTQAIYGNVTFGNDHGGILENSTQTALIFDSSINEPSWQDAIIQYTYRYEDSLPFIGHALVKETEPVPEPATMLLLGSGLVGLAGFRKKLKRT